MRVRASCLQLACLACAVSGFNVPTVRQLVRSQSQDARASDISCVTSWYDAGARLSGEAEVAAPALPADPEEAAALAFGAALSAAWSSGSAQLSGTMRSDCVVNTPVWKCADRAAYESELAGANEFFKALSAPALTVLSSRKLRDGRVQLSWSLGVEWPAIWRPRINILGESTLSFSSGGGGGAPLVSRVEERWHQSPNEAFTSQVLPKFRDLSSLWCSPTAEHVPMPVVGSGDGYELRRLPPMLALQSEMVETGELLVIEQAPIAPAFAFGGEVKRADWYNCVSPGLLERSFTTVQLPGGRRQTGQRRRWISPLPTRFGTDPSAFPTAEVTEEDREALPDLASSAALGYVKRPAQLLAVKRIKGIPSNEVIELCHSPDLCI